MKGFRNKMRGLTQRPNNSTAEDGAAQTVSHDDAAPSMHDDSNEVSEGNETPEAMAARLVKAFCMSEVDEAGAEVALLPSIVEAAESSPKAAAECARFIRKFMYREYWSRPNFVYNAIMLMRILVENPGLTFTRNMDKKFVDTVRDLLRGCHHAHIVHFLIEALQDFEAKGAVDEGLGRIVEMWRKEKEKSKKDTSSSSRSHRPNPVPPVFHNQGWVPPGHMSGGSPFEHRSGRHSSLPRPRELKKRLEEAKTTASVLADVVNTNSGNNLLNHDLTDDLSSRCRRATGQILDYLNMRDPMPDNEEMVALLATHEALQQSLHHYFRAVLETRKQLGIGESRRGENGNVPAEMTPAGKGKGAAPMSPTDPAGPSDTNGHSNDYDQRARSNGVANAYGNGDGHETTHYDHSSSNRFSRNEDDDDIAAAIAASRASGGGSHHPQLYPGGPATESDNPFADNAQAGSSRSSSQIRHPYGSSGGGGSGGGGGGGGSSSSAAAATGHDAPDLDLYSDNDGPSDSGENSRQQQKGKNAAAGGAGSSSTQTGAAGGADVSPVEPEGHYYTTAAGGASSSSAVVDAAAHSSGQYGTGPVYRY